MEYFLAIVAAGLLGAGFVLQQAVAQRAPKRDFLHLRLLADLLSHKRWLAGVATMVAGQLVAAWVIAHLELSVAEPLLAANLLFALLLAWPLSGQPLTKLEIAGAFMLIAGVSLLSVARSGADTSVGSAGNWPFAGAGVALVCYVFAVLGRRQAGELRAMLTGVSAGVAFGVQDALTRRTVQVLISRHAAEVLTSWPAYALVAVGAVSLWLMQNAFSAGPLRASLAPITAGEPVTGIALGIVVFGDQLHTSPGMVALQVAGIVSLVAGVVLVARGPALGAIRPVQGPG